MRSQGVSFDGFFVACYICTLNFWPLTHLPKSQAHMQQQALQFSLEFFDAAFVNEDHLKGFFSFWLPCIS